MLLGLSSVAVSRVLIAVASLVVYQGSSAWALAAAAQELMSGGSQVQSVGAQ